MSNEPQRSRWGLLLLGLLGAGAGATILKRRASQATSLGGAPAPSLHLTDPMPAERPVRNDVRPLSLVGEPDDTTHANSDASGTGPSGGQTGDDVVASSLQEAARVLGRSVKRDDLKLVEGIGEKIAELCHGIGVTTWAQLEATPVERLQRMLDDGGSRFAMHDPGTWPRQAALLAAGRWEEFRDYTDSLSGGR